MAALDYLVAVRVKEVGDADMSVNRPVGVIIEILTIRVAVIGLQMFSVPFVTNLS